MSKDQIAEIGIDDQGRLYITPHKATFPYIYREGKEVSWDEEKKCLYSPKPKEWTYLMWYMHIIAVAKDCACELSVTKKTRWVSIPETLKMEINELSLSNTQRFNIGMLFKRKSKDNTK